MKKMTKMVVDQPQIYWSSAAQPCDQITGPVMASTAHNSQRDLAKTACEESDHRDIALQSKIDQGQD